MSEQITKVTILTKVSNGYNEFERLLAPLTQGQMLAPALRYGHSSQPVASKAGLVTWVARSVAFTAKVC